MRKNSITPHDGIVDIILDCNNVNLGNTGSVLCISAVADEDSDKLEVMSSCRGSADDIVAALYNVYEQESEFRDIINALFVNIVYTSNK